MTKGDRARPKPVAGASMGVALEPIRSGVVPIDGWVPASSAVQTFRYVDIGSVDREAKRLFGAAELLVTEAPSRARQLLRADDVLVSTVRPSLNAVAMVPAEYDGVVGSTGFTVLRSDRARLLPRYLFHWVRTPMFVAEMTKRATGASYPAVSDRIVLESRMPMPGLEEQGRVADVLDTADAIRRKRNAAKVLSDELLRSAFLEMFGDPVTNPKNWPVRPLGDLADIVSGVAKGKRYRSEALVSVPYMRVANVHDGHLALDEVKTIVVSSGEAIRYQLKPGDVLLTEGGDPDKLGRGAVWRGEIPDCIHQNHIFRVRSGPLLRPEFLSAVAGSERGKRYFLGAAKQTTGIASINLTQLKAFPVLVPPLGQQDEYLRRMARIEAMQQRFDVRMEQSDALFNALVARAFSDALEAVC